MSMITPLRGHSSSRAPAASPAGDGGIESATRSQLLQAFAAGLLREAAPYVVGRKDGEEGAPFRPLEFDPLSIESFSYASGFAHGRQFPKRGGDNAL